MFNPIKAAFGLLRQRSSTDDLAISIDAIEAWFDSPLGQQLLLEEQKILNEELNCLFGYHLMQLSVNRNACFYQNSRINHCFSLAAGRHSESPCVGAFSSFEQLPLNDEVVDVTVLHHALEFSPNPHQVLKEACRVTIPRGYIVIMGFNPLSLMGLVKPFAQLLSKQQIWKRQSLRQSRVSDWLQFLDCNVVSTRSSLHNVPWQNGRYISYADALGRRFGTSRLPFGNIYCMVARKDRACITPVKPDWNKKPNFEQVKPAMTARDAPKLALIKGSKPSSNKSSP